MVDLVVAHIQMHWGQVNNLCQVVLVAVREAALILVLLFKVELALIKEVRVAVLVAD
jgi:hypothetical protein